MLCMFVCVLCMYQGQLKNAILYDWDAVQGATDALKVAFPSNACHCFAAKAAPLPYLLHHFVRAGFGVEAASITELRLALRLSCPPEKVK
jgi:diaminopimelate decarboxylase